MKNYKVYQIILLLTPFVFSFALGLDIYIPIVPQMTEIFNTSAALIHLTLSLFLFTTGFGQLFFGPLADRYGRKAIFYVASLCYAIGALQCAFSTEIFSLIAGRFICAIGACGMLVTPFALIRDLYSKEESAKMYSFINGAIGISPTFAPMVGGYLSTLWGWQSIFIFLALVGVLALFLTYYLIEETQESSQRVPLNKTLFFRYWLIIKDRQFLVYTFISGLAEGIFFCFFSISPFIIIDVLRVPTENFGYYFAVFGAVIGIGGFVSGKLIEKKGVHTAIISGIFLMLMGGAAMLAWAYFTQITLFGFLFPMVLACTGAIFVVGACASAALEAFAPIAGTAAAAFGALQFSIASVIGATLMLWPVDSTVPYGVSILMMGALSFLCYQQRPIQRQAVLE